jgi:protein-disulfide isomerase
MSSPPGAPGGSRRTQLIVLGAMAALIVVVAIVINQSGSGDDSTGGSASDGTAQVEQTLAGIPQDGVFLGKPDAAATVTEFVDLQCPFCGEFARKALPDVIDQHVRSGEIRLEQRVISFLGDDSRTAARLAAAATLQNKLFDFTETFYLNQGEENSGYVTDDFLTQIAEATPGLDSQRALADRDSPEAQAVVDENESEASSLGVNSTPTFFLVVGGKRTEMQLTALTAEAFSSALESARSGG